MSLLKQKFRFSESGWGPRSWIFYRFPGYGNAGGWGPHSLLQGDRKHFHQIPSCHPRLTESDLKGMGLKNDVLRESLGNFYAF